MSSLSGRMSGVTDQNHVFSAWIQVWISSTRISRASFGLAVYRVRRRQVSMLRYSIPARSSILTMRSPVVPTGTPMRIRLRQNKPKSQCRLSSRCTERPKDWKVRRDKLTITPTPLKGRKRRSLLGRLKRPRKRAARARTASIDSHVPVRILNLSSNGENEYHWNRYRGYWKDSSGRPMEQAGSLVAPTKFFHFDPQNRVGVRCRDCMRRQGTVVHRR
jgi:hypothetical protein